MAEWTSAPEAHDGYVPARFRVDRAAGLVALTVELDDDASTSSFGPTIGKLRIGRTEAQILIRRLQQALAP